VEAYREAFHHKGKSKRTEPLLLHAYAAPDTPKQKARKCLLTKRSVLDDSEAVF
jgi:hypothetical protein